ncbi:MAG TPA: hypothetical protein VEL07_00630 [Planctomycetota bacterium]|nr:hypothetical protein [Planctomycetota bacterium]
MSSRLIVCLLAICAAASAGEPAVPPPVVVAPAVDDEPAFRPFLLGWDAGDGGTLSLDPKQVSSLAGGVVVRYEKAFVACERIEFWLSLVPGEEQLLERAELTPGPNARDPKRVLLDSSQSKVDLISFRGVLTPSRITLQRKREAVDPPDEVRYEMRLEELGGFHGALRMPDGWQPVVGWADHADIVLKGRVVEKRLGDLAIISLHLHGVTGDSADQRRRAWLIEVDPKKVADSASVDIPALVAQADGDEDADSDDRIWKSMQGSTALTLAFDDAGQFKGAGGAADFRVRGVPMQPPTPKSRLRTDD